MFSINFTNSSGWDASHKQLQNFFGYSCPYSFTTEFFQSSTTWSQDREANKISISETAENKIYHLYPECLSLTLELPYFLKTPPTNISNLAWWTWRLFESAVYFLRKGYYLFSWQPYILPLNFKFIIQQINVWGFIYNSLFDTRRSFRVRRLIEKIRYVKIACKQRELRI